MGTALLPFRIKMRMILIIKIANESNGRAKY